MNNLFPLLFFLVLKCQIHFPKNLIVDTLTEKISATSLILKNNFSFGKFIYFINQMIDFFEMLLLAFSYCSGVRSL